MDFSDYLIIIVLILFAVFIFPVVSFSFNQTFYDNGGGMIAEKGFELKEIDGVSSLKYYFDVSVPMKYFFWNVDKEKRIYVEQNVFCKYSEGDFFVIDELHSNN